MSLLQDMLQHAREESPKECCGLVVASGRRSRLIRARNIALKPVEHFDLDPVAWLEVADGETVVGIYHSHPHTNAQPSAHDLTACESSGLPWHIVNPHTEEYQLVEPCGYIAPYEGRPYLYGVLDCYTVVRDWYRGEWGIVLPDFVREPNFWGLGKNTFVENIPRCGFTVLTDAPMQRGDLVLVQHGATVPNHIALYLGNGTILHHVQDRLSKVDPYGGVWQRHQTHHLRHESRLGIING